jgi:uncharacterized repeat protein (TIGR03803 family)
MRQTTRLAVFFCFTFSLAVISNVAQAQTFNVLFTFGGGQTGAYPTSNVTLDAAGNLYGTTYAGGSGPCASNGYNGCGTVFRLERHGSGWVLQSLYSFQGNGDGAYPYLGGVSFGPDGTLYGSTEAGGLLVGQECQLDNQGCGTVFRLQPPPNICKSVSCPWTQTTLYQFTDGADGDFPAGQPAIDQSGNIYGVTDYTAYELSRTGNNWMFNLLYTFEGTGYESTGVILDSAGHLYGYGAGGLYEEGVVYELANSQSGWMLDTLWNFQGQTDGAHAYGLVRDNAGNLYGSTNIGGRYNSGTVFEVSPSDGGWTFTIIYNFGYIGSCGGGGSLAPLALDSSGNLYGTTLCTGAYGYGSVFELTPSDGGWTYRDLHDFTNGADGAYPISGLAIDSSRNILGFTEYGANGYGTIFEITP